MLLSTGGSGTEFVYGASHWTEPTTLNDNMGTLSSMSNLLSAVSERDSNGIQEHAVDAKMSTFNRLRVREFMAYWPSVDDEYEPGSEKSNTLGPGNAVGLSGAVSNTTALQFFNKGQVFFTSPSGTVLVA